MKPIFNSLGSNYSLSFALQALQQIGASKQADLQKLTQALENKFTGKAFLFYKGRDAIEFATRVLSPSSAEVILTQAFTCYAIEEGITRAGAQTVYVDLAADGLNPTVQTIEAALTKQIRKKPIALIIQHTLGVPAEIAAIHAWCQKNQVTLIEDVAQAVGGEVGQDADIIICSFGRDKIIDAVSGGAVIFKQAEQIQKATALYQTISFRLPSIVVTKDMTYPFLTWLIRHTHHLLIGKIIFQIVKRIGWFSSPIASPTKTMTKLPAAYAPLALQQLQHLPEQIAHRQKIAQVYDQKLANNSQHYQKIITTAQIQSSSNLRYPLWVEQPTELARRLKQKNIFLSDRWYRSAVDYGSLKRTSVYQENSCPRAEAVAAHMINLPTHLGITIADAERLVIAITESYS